MLVNQSLVHMEHGDPNAKTHCEAGQEGGDQENGGEKDRVKEAERQETSREEDSSACSLSGGLVCFSYGIHHIERAILVRGLRLANLYARHEPGTQDCADGNEALHAIP